MLTSAGSSSRGFLASMTIHEREREREREKERERERESKTDYDMHIQEN